MPKRYVPSVTAINFFASTAFFQGIMGVVGSGKTSVLVQKTIRVASKQFPNALGRRRVRAAVIRNHYPELRSTTIRTFLEWYFDVLEMKYGTPIEGIIYRKLQDGTVLELELVFLAVDRPEDTGKLRSLDLTFAVVNEASEIEEAVITMLRGRVGRFPPENEGGATWAGILADTNPPPISHWWYRYAETEKPRGFEFFRQPPALLYDPETETYQPNPDAENIQFLPGGYQYYFNQLEGADSSYINTMVLGNYGVSIAGTPVHPAYSDHMHVSEEFLQPILNLPIYFGMDFGLNPAIVFGQMMPNGVLVIIAAFHAFNILLDEFLDEYVVPYRVNELRNRGVQGFGDPSGDSRSPLDSRNAYMRLRGPQYRMPISPVTSNKFQTRKDSLDKFLYKKNGLLLDPRLAFLREGLSGGYRYPKNISGMAGRLPDKNLKHSHVVDALQYLCQGLLFGGKDDAVNTPYFAISQQTNTDVRPYVYA